jgi:hypothetical protein
MLIENFQLSVPTHISFTLYKYNLIDSLIISNVFKECKNYSVTPGVYKIKASNLINTINLSPRLSAELKKTTAEVGDSKFRPNSVYFINNIIKSLPNLDWVSFKVSDETEYSRVLKYEDQELTSFYYRIEEGYLDLPKIFNRTELDEFNKALISIGVMPNNYLERYSYISIEASDLLDLMATTDYIEGGSTISNRILNILDLKIDEDNPVLIVKTDYTLY